MVELIIQFINDSNPSYEDVFNLGERILINESKVWLMAIDFYLLLV
jgi:hypothetical protein